MRCRQAPGDGRALHVGGTRYCWEHDVSLGCRARARSCGRNLMHGHRASCPAGRPVLRRRHVLSLAPTAHCLGAVGSATPAIHCPAAWGQWAVDLLQCTVQVPGGSGQWNSCNALPHCLGAVGSGTPGWGVLWCGVVWCGVVWCGVVWCGVVWCGVPKALLPKGKRPGCLPTGTGKWAGLCVLCARCE